MGINVRFGSILCWLRQLVEAQGYESPAEAADEDDQALCGDGHNLASEFATECNKCLYSYKMNFKGTIP